MKFLRIIFVLSFLIFKHQGLQTIKNSRIKKSKVLENYNKQFGLEENMIKPSKTATFIKNPFIDEEDNNKKNRRLDQDNIDQFYQSGDKNLDNVIDGVREVQKEGRPVIVINHNSQEDPFSLNQQIQQKQQKSVQQNDQPQFDESSTMQQSNQGQIDQQTNDDYHFTSIQTPQSSSKTSPYYLTQSEFQAIFETLSNISSIFHVFFDGFPQWEDEEKSTLSKSVDMLRFYVKIKKFVNYIYANQNQLGKDVDYLSKRIHLLKSTQEDMLRFYEVDHIFFEANLKYNQLTFNGKQTLKAQIDNEFQQITETTYLYDTDVKKAFSSVYNLNKFTQFFLQQIDSLKNNQYESSLMNALDKFDAIMMLTYRVLTMKSDIEKSIIDLQESLQNIKAYKPQLELNLETIQKYLELVKLTQKEDVKEDVKGSFLIANSMLLIFIFLFGLL